MQTGEKEKLKNIGKTILLFIILALVSSNSTSITWKIVFKIRNQKIENINLHKKPKKEFLTSLEVAGTTFCRTDFDVDGTQAFTET
jgi:hypothetical protein